MLSAGHSRTALRALLLVVTLTASLWAHVATAHASAYSDAVLADHPLAYWPLDDASGATAHDASGNGHGATIYGSPSLSQPGVRVGSTSMHFDGQTQYIETPVTRQMLGDFTQTSTEVTFEAWMAPELGALSPSATNPMYLGNYDVSTPNFDWFGLEGHPDGSQGGNMTAKEYDGTDSIVDGNVPYDGSTWSYVVATLDGSNYHLYINGQLVGSHSRLAPQIAPAQVLYLARASSATGGGAPYKGRLQDVAVYDYALSATQIQNHYNIGVGIANTSPPSVTGKAQVGQTLTATNGVWAGNGPFSYAYQWQRCDWGGGNCQNIAGATASTYAQTSTDFDHTLRVSVTAMNAYGSATSISLPRSGPVSTTGTDYSDVVLSDGPVAYWKMNETSGSTLYDSSGNGLNATLYGSPALGQQGYNSTSTSVHFDGSSQYAQTPLTRQSLGDFTQTSTQVTYEMWLGPEQGASQSYGTNPMYLGNFDASTPNWHWFGVEGHPDGSQGGNMTVKEYDGTDSIVDGNVPYDGETWSYVVATLDGSDYHLYINGQLVGSHARLAPQIDPAQVLYLARAASSGSGGGQHYRGRMQDVAVYDYALSAAQIAAHYKAMGPSSAQHYGPPPNGNGAGVQDPVNAATGNVYTSAQDLELNGRGPAALWLRTYNSQDATPGPFGYGWTADYNATLAVNGDGSVTERDPQGAQLVFESNGSGGFTAPAGVLDVLTKNSDGSYTLTKPNGVQWHFNSGGQLTAIVDTNSNMLTFGYTNGQLTSIMNAAGRTMTLSYSGGYVQSITDGTRTVSYTYDSAGNLHTVTDPNGNVTTYEYDSNHHLTDILTPGSSTDPGEDQHFTYDAEGRALTTSGKNNAHYAAFAYNTPGPGQTTITDARGNQSVYTYDSNGDVTSITDPYGKTQSWGWTNGLKTSYTDQLGNTTIYKYDANGNMTEMDRPAPASGGAQLVSKWAYGAFNEVTDKWDPSHNHTHRVYDSHGNLTSVTDPVGNVTSYTYDPSNGDLLTKTTPAPPGAPASTTTTYGYDPTTGELLTVKDPLGNATTYGYDALGRRTSVQSPNGATTTYKLDNDGNITLITYPPASQGAQQGTVTMSYDPRNNLTSVTDQNGHTMTMTYDPQNSLLTKTDATGRTTTTTYDAEEKVASVKDNAGNITSYTYDNVERLIAVTKPDGSPSGSQTQTSYYDNGLVKTVTDPDGNVTTYYYDNDGRLTSVKDSSGNSTTAYAYNPDGTKSSVTDPNGKTTNYTYNADGSVLTKTDPLTHTWTNTYVGGYLATSTDPMGQETDYTYDGLGRVINETFPGSSTTTQQWFYTPDGQVDHTIDGTGTTQYSYDALDRLTSKQLPGGRTIGYGYDLAGQRQSMTLPGQTASVQYAYDNAGRLQTLTDPSSNVTTYSYNTDGLLGDVAYPNGAAEHYVYDPMGRVDSVENDATGAALISKLTYAYDKASNPTSITDQNNNQATLGYDALNRLTSESAPAGFAVSGAPAIDRTYTYDAAGNRLTLVTGGVTTTYGYNVDEQLTSVTPSSGPATTYGYNNDGQLTSEQVGTGTPTSFSYDPLGELTRAGSDTYAYDITGNRVSQTSGGNATTQLFDGASVVQQTTGTATTSYLYGADGIASVTDPTGAGSYYGHDALGSVLALTNASGAVTDHYAYDAFGENTAHTGSAAQPFGFMSNQTDPTTGLGNFNAREYDPTVGRFLSQDPVPGNPAAPQTLDAYAYADGNPFVNPDPLGMSTDAQGNLDMAGTPLTDPFVGLAGCAHYLCEGSSEAGIDKSGLATDGVGSSSQCVAATSNFATDALARVGGFFDGFTQPFFGGTAALRGRCNWDTSDPQYRLAQSVGGIDVRVESGVAGSAGATSLLARTALPKVLTMLYGGSLGSIGEGAVARHYKDSAGGVMFDGTAGATGGTAAWLFPNLSDGASGAFSEVISGGLGLLASG